jgi:predicted aspartyl protease
MATNTSSRYATGAALIAATLGLSAACSTPRPLPASGEATVQIQTIRGNTFVSVRVNDSSLGTLFLVDTGATYTVLSPRFAQRLGLDIPDDAPRRDLTVFGGRKVSVPFVRVRRVAVDAASVPDLLVGVYDVVPSSGVIDGVLGNDFLHRFRVTLDTERKLMHLTPVVAAAPPSSSGSAPRVEQSRPRGAPLRGAQTVDGRKPDAAFSTALATPPLWKPGYEWSYRWHSPQGSGTFVWSVDREDVVDGIPVYVIKAGQRETFYRRSDLALYMERSQGVTETRWVPPVIRYSWPFTPGKTWEQTYTRERPLDRQTEVRTLECRSADREEQLTVPAGTFTSLRVTCRLMPAGSLSHEFWHSPEVRHWVRERTHFSYGVRERELTSYKVEGR